MKLKKALSTIVYIVVIVAVVLGFKFYNQSEASSDIKAQVMDVVRQLPGYSDDEYYYETLLDDCHDEAFRKAYHMGGRYQKDTFDPQKYMDELYARMIEKAKQDGRRRVVTSMTLRRHLFSNARVVVE